MRSRLSASPPGCAAIPRPRPRHLHRRPRARRRRPDAAVAAAVSDDEKLAAIQKAMNDLDEAAQQCWAAAATERFDVEGDVTAQIDIGAERSHATIVHDTTRNQRLSKCLVDLLLGLEVRRRRSTGSRSSCRSSSARPTGRA